MNGITIDRADSGAQELTLPEYERPSLKVMEQDDVLEAFQITSTEISAAGCWWSIC